MRSLLCLCAVLSLLALANAQTMPTIQCKDTLPVLCYPYRNTMCSMLKDERLAILLAQVDKVITELNGWDEKNKGQWIKAIEDFRTLFDVKVSAWMAALSSVVLRWVQ